MRRASQAWLASARSQPPPLSTQIYTRIGARSAATILTCATGSSARSASLLSTATKSPTLRTAFTTAASTTLCAPTLLLLLPFNLFFFLMEIISK
jgi:hypothetical protein